MKFGVIIGSHRVQSASAKVARFARGILAEIDPGAEFFTLDLHKTPLPFWDEGVWDGAASWKALWDPISLELKSCDAFVVVSPEYHGMVPAALKNFFLLAGHGELGHKPGLIVAVSGGRGGAYPVAELRMSSYKNSRLNWIPEHMIVRNADHVLNGEVSVSDDDSFARSRLAYCLSLLRQYGIALALVRKSGVIDHKTHPSGL